jgi:putative ABC transport system permease protein
MGVMRSGLLGEVVAMSFDTVRTNKLRSALTVLGVVIGITSIVGMTSLIRGFDESLRDSIRELGPNTVFIAKFSGVSILGGKDFVELLKRPNITLADARAIVRESPSVQWVDVMLGAGGMNRDRIFYRNKRSKEVMIFGATDNFAQVNFMRLEAGRFFTGAEVQHRRNVVVIGQTPYMSLFGAEGIDPIGKKVRVGSDEFTVIGVFGKRPDSGGLNSNADDFVVIPLTSHEKMFGRTGASGRVRVNNRVVDASAFRSAMIAIVPREDAGREAAIREAETVMRIRHGLRLDEPNDFDIVTQDAALKVWDQFSRATFLALVVISSIALMVGGIGVMAIMMISVTERTREIGVRKALGARRREILWQFLIEAAFLTSAGGILGILFGSAIGVGVHWITGFPVSLPWWSFALGIGFSASVGIFFGLFPAIKASRLDPIEALRYE